MKVDKERLANYQNKIHGTMCPLCSSKNWSISDTVFQVLEFDLRGLILGGSTYPIIPITCLNCGNTYFINALVAGLIDRDDKANPEKQ